MASRSQNTFQIFEIETFGLIPGWERRLRIIERGTRKQVLALFEEDGALATMDLKRFILLSSATEGEEFRRRRKRCKFLEGCAPSPSRRKRMQGHKVQKQR